MLLTYFLRSTPISCGAETGGTNAYLLGKDVFEAEKYSLFRWQDDLMNRLIHRSWGEVFVNISLDLLAGSRHEMHGTSFNRRHNGGTCFETKLFSSPPRNHRPQGETTIDRDRHQYALRQHFGYTSG